MDTTPPTPPAAPVNSYKALMEGVCDLIITSKQASQTLPQAIPPLPQASSALSRMVKPYSTSVNLSAISTPRSTPSRPRWRPRLDRIKMIPLRWEGVTAIFELDQLVGII
jgi:hypothetical protein